MKRIWRWLTERFADYQRRCREWDQKFAPDVGHGAGCICDQCQAFREEGNRG